MTLIKLAARVLKSSSLVIITSKNPKLKDYGLSSEEIRYINQKIKDDEKSMVINQLKRLVFIKIKDEKKTGYGLAESLRIEGAGFASLLNKHKYSEVQIIDLNAEDNNCVAMAEGMSLSNYQFLKYRKNAKKETNSLTTINVVVKKNLTDEIDILNNTIEATCIARDLVNEPQSYLTAEQFSKEMQVVGKKAGFNVEVFNKAKIKALKMGGLLAVNMGSQLPPTFNVMEYKPKNAKNKNPYVLVGKGVVYDTGGLSLKPTANSMDYMKCDMAGGAAVVGTMYAIAKNKLPIYVVGLVPATDNRPGENAYCPGDVLTMMDGQTVEMLNADAEGRLILADALHYAKRYEPALTIDLATLTGAAAAAIGGYGIVAMGTAGEEIKNGLKESANNVYERLVEFPLWDEYGDLLKSDIADFKNIGGPTAGAITAGKFLEKFIDYPWMHFDIAGPAFTHKTDKYRGNGGTGIGVRLLFDFLRKQG
jgi:leucyl aminopeptidase